jgi:hypothetical protein
MSEEKPIIHTRAFPSDGEFPLNEINDLLQQNLTKISKFDPDYFKSERRHWLEVKKHSPLINDRIFNLRNTEIDRDELLFGGNACALLEGIVVKNVAVKLIIGVKLITATIKDVITPENENEALLVIPKIKQIIYSKYQKVTFEDVQK